MWRSASRSIDDELGLVVEGGGEDIPERCIVEAHLWRKRVSERRRKDDGTRAGKRTLL
jgi:hypothetical protein